MSSKGSEHKEVTAKRKEGSAAKTRAGPTTYKKQGGDAMKAGKRILWLAGESHTELEERLRNPGGGTVSFQER